MQVNIPARLWRVLVVFSLLLAVAAASTNSTQSSGLGNPSIEEVKAAIVSIWPSGECRKPGTATGFFITFQGHILTAVHVVGSFEIGETVTVQWAPPGQEPQLLTAKILAKKPEWDTAFLQVQEEGEFPWLRLGNSDQVREGDSVTILGFPEPESLGCTTPTLTTGQVTARKPPGELGESYQAEALQISVAPIRPGSSGSPVLNEAGEVIGILFAGTGIPGLGTELPFYFAVPINVAIDMVIAPDPSILPPYSPEITFLEFPSEIVADGQPVRGRIGFRDLNADLVTAQFKVVEAEELEIEGARELGIFYQIFPGVQGQIKGEIEFFITTTVPQERITLEVSLIDAEGNESSPWPFSFRARSPYSPPEIVFFRCPERIPADGREHQGLVGFKDREGDIVRAVFDVVRGHYEPFTLNLREYPDEEPIFRQKEGEFEFIVRTTVPSDVILKLTLIDAYGLESQPKECSFVAERIWPDLTVSFSDSLSERIQLGQTLDVAYIVRNLGRIDSGPFRVGVYLSSDATITPGDLLLKSNEVSNLAAWASLTERVSVELTQDLLAQGGLRPGLLFLGVIADDLNQVEESDESNNIASSQLLVDTVCPSGCLFAKIQAAIDAARSGDTIGIGPGTYNENLEVRKSLTLWGVGPEQTVIKGKAEGDPVIWIASNSKIRVTIESLTVSEAKGEEDGIWAGGKAEVAIQKAQVSSNGQHGVRVADAARAEISNSTVSKNLRDGILVGESAQAEITDSIISENLWDGIEVLSSAWAEITHSTISGNMWDEIWIGHSAQVQVISSSFSRNQNNGISMGDSARSTITDVAISGNKANGVALSGSARAEISGSIISDNQWGTWIGEFSGVEISGSTISRSKHNGVGVGDSAVAEITDSIIPENGEFGIGIWGSAQASISGSTVSENRRGGIGIDGSTQAQVTGSDISGNKYNGIATGGSAKATIVDSTISGNEVNGLWIGDSSVAEIINSIISENGSGGIGIGTSAQAKITGSTISVNKANGFWVKDYAQAEITDTTISGNLWDGICISNLAQATITNSTVSANKNNSIVLQNSAQATITNSTISEGCAVSPVGGAGGILLGQSTRARIEGNKITNNAGYGVSLYQRPCYDTDDVFTGYISGRANTIPGPGEPDGNDKGAVCPPELEFLMTEEGREYP